MSIHSPLLSALTRYKKVFQYHIISCYGTVAFVNNLMYAVIFAIKAVSAGAISCNLSQLPIFSFCEIFTVVLVSCALSNLKFTLLQ